MLHHYPQVFTPAMFAELKLLMGEVNFPHVDKVSRHRQTDRQRVQFVDLLTHDVCHASLFLHTQIQTHTHPYIHTLTHTHTQTHTHTHTHTGGGVVEVGFQQAQDYHWFH
jgi:hypothetical protein